MSNVALLISGVVYEGWESVSISRSLDSIAGTFSLQVATAVDASSKPISIRCDTQCDLMIDNQPVISGFIVSIDQAINATAHTITITGRDKAGELVDCSVRDCSSEFKNVSLISILSAIANPYGIEVESNRIFELVGKFAIQPGEKCYEAINRLANRCGVLCVSTGTGSIRITRTGNTYASDDLVYGENIKSAQAKFTSDNRYHDYVVIGSQSGDDESSTQIQAIATDSFGPRNRKLIINVSGKVDTGIARKRALWEAATRAGKSGVMQIDVCGWKQSSGNLWIPNLLVDVNIPLFGIEYQPLLISEVNYTLDGNGEIAHLTIKRPDAYLPEPLSEKRVKAKQDPWNAVRSSTGSKL